MSDEWFCLVLGQELGPLSLADLTTMADSGQLLKSDSVRIGCDGEWQVAGEVESLWPIDFSACDSGTAAAATANSRRRILAASIASVAVAVVSLSGFLIWPQTASQVAIVPRADSPASVQPVNQQPAPMPPAAPAPQQQPQDNRKDSDASQPDAELESPVKPSEPQQPDARSDRTAVDQAPSEPEPPAGEQSPNMPEPANNASPDQQAPQPPSNQKHVGPEIANDSATSPGIPAEVVSQEPKEALGVSSAVPLETRLEQLQEVYTERLALLIEREILRSRIKLAEESVAEADAELVGIGVSSAAIVAQMNGATGVIDLDRNQILQAQLDGLSARAVTLGARKLELANELDGYTDSMDKLMVQSDALRAKWLALVDPFGSFACGDHELAILKFTEWIRIDGENAGAYLARGFALWQLGKLAEAINDFNEAVKVGGPMLATSLAARGGAMFAAGYEKEAMADFGNALKADKGECLIYLFRGRSYCALDRFPLARKDFKAAVALNPKDPEVLKNIALLEAACPKPSFRNAKLAIKHATAANDLTEGKSWSAVDALGAAYAESGDFDTAAQHAREAAGMAWGEHRDECLYHLSLYEKKEPLRLNWKELIRQVFPKQSPRQRR